MLSIRKFGVLLLIVCFCFSISFAQQPTQSSMPPIPRDAQALTIVTSALNAMGGQTAIAAIQDVDSSGTCADITQTGTATSSTPATFRWTVSGNEYRYETVANGVDTIAVSGQGNPSRSLSGVVNPVSSAVAQASLPYHLPGVLLLTELNDPTYMFRYAGIQQTATGPAQEIVVAIAGFAGPIVGSVQQWYFSVATNQPIQVSYEMPSEQDEDLRVPVTETFSQYTPADGVLLPYQIQIAMGNFLVSNCTASTVQVNQHPSASVFDLTDGGAQ